MQQIIAAELFGGLPTTEVNRQLRNLGDFWKIISTETKATPVPIKNDPYACWFTITLVVENQSK